MKEPLPPATARSRQFVPQRPTPLERGLLGPTLVAADLVLVSAARRRHGGLADRITDTSAVAVSAPGVEKPPEALPITNQDPPCAV